MLQIVQFEFQFIHWKKNRSVIYQIDNNDDNNDMYNILIGELKVAPLLLFWLVYWVVKRVVKTNVDSFRELEDTNFDT